MNHIGFPDRIFAAIAPLLRRVTPHGTGAGFLLAGILPLLALAIYALDPRPAFLAVAWILCSATAILLAVLVRRINARFEKISESLESIGLGELSGRVDTILEGEAGRLVDSLRQMNQGLTEMVGQVRGSAETIEVAATEIAAGSSELSQRTEQQAASLEETAASMEELTSTVKQNSESAREAKDLARHASEVATRGGEIVGSLVTTMREIHGSSKKITEILTLIDSIAFQTNILALNAAVEAARAGEQGRGFAVVAGEVRSLAQRSAESAKEIKRLIHESTDRVENGSSLASQAGMTMGEVVAAVRQVSELIAGIADASTQQSAGIQEINQTITVMEQVTQQTAALVEQTHGAAQMFEREVGNLQEVVGHFKLDRAEGRHTAVALVRRGAAHLRKVGKRQACDDFDNPKGEFIFGEYYLWAMDLNGIRMANGSDPASRGQDISNLRDIDGRPHVRNIIEKARAKGKGWQDYKWLNPVTKRVEMKSAYFELAGDIILACGIYKNDSAGGALQRATAAQFGSLQPANPLRIAPHAR